MSAFRPTQSIHAQSLGTLPNLNRSFVQFCFAIGAGRNLCFGNDNTHLLGPLTHLVRLLDAPQSIKFMAPLIMKEILYTVMNDKGGEFLRKYLMDGSITQQVVKVISKIKNDFAKTINMKELAKTFGMSESSLYHNFKKITLMSPLQFQKTLRLEEARRMLLSQNKEATQIAFAVGYERPSQFSREYRPHVWITAKNVRQNDSRRA